MAQLPRYDTAIAARLSRRARAKVLRYTGTLSASAGDRGTKELDARHAFANIALTDNVVRFATRRYCDNPLIVQGPGAGPEVTAAGCSPICCDWPAYLGAAVSPARSSARRRSHRPRGQRRHRLRHPGFAVEALGDRVTVTRRAEPV